MVLHWYKTESVLLLKEIKPSKCFECGLGVRNRVKGPQGCAPGGCWWLMCTVLLGVDGAGGREVLVLWVACHMGWQWVSTQRAL